MKDLIRHHSQQIAFRNPFGAAAAGGEVTLRLQIEGVLPAEVSLRLWQDGVGETLLPMRPDRAAGFYGCTAVMPKRIGVVWYYFIIQLADQTVYYGNNEQNLGGEGAVYHTPPPSFQITVYHADAHTPHWFKEAIIYQIFPDRFYNGDPDGKISGAKKDALLHASWDSAPYYVKDVDTKEIVAYDFFGGNLQGMIEKLSYFQELGVTALYLNPIFESVSNHRYDTGDYHRVDPMLGDETVFAELCAQAKARGIAVILDGVFSHTGSDSKYFNRYGTYAATGAYQSRESPYFEWYRFAQYPAQYESWWGIDTMPNVEETCPSYMDFVIRRSDSVLKHWLRLGAKGWRLDVVDELPELFVKTFYKTLKECDPDAVLIGEVWEDASNKISYGQLRTYLCGDELDAAMNYPFRQALLDFFLGTIDAAQANRRLMSLYENYPAEHFYAMMNLIGSHDVPRVLTVLGEASETGMSAARQAKYRLPAAKRDLAVRRLKLMSLWQMTFPGAPTIYYGDEAGVEGHRDPFNRRTYPWGRIDEELLAWYRKLTALRNAYPALKTGRWLPLLSEGDVIVFARRIFGGYDQFGQARADNTLLVLLNRNRFEARKAAVDMHRVCRGVFRDLLSDQAEFVVRGGVLTASLPPLSGRVLLRTEYEAFPRAAGVLLHPTSLPSRYGIGDLGRGAYEFVNFLRRGRQKIWQILPLNPPGYGYSPYQALSAFAGNPLLISLGKLVAEGLLAAKDVRSAQEFDPDRVEFESVRLFKERCFRRAFANFRKMKAKSVPYAKFCAEQGPWLEKYALFMALKHHFNGACWKDWPASVARRSPKVLVGYRRMLAVEIEYHKFLQFIFFKQWGELRDYARRHDVAIVGDMPIFVAYDSADVWANQRLFELDEDGAPTKVAGVPPDYFSKTGQLWGNPHYRWDVMAADQYQWWCDRFRVLLKLVDIIRIDHFRGFEAYWEVDAGAKTAARGRWADGPGAAFFQALERQLGKLPLIAEDLGVITEDVEELKEELFLPGMKVLQFALDAPDSAEPFVCEKNCVVYTGTHDNNTTVGWYENDLDDAARARLRDTLDAPEDDAAAVCRALIRFAYASNANTAVIPIQDLFELDGGARLNRPGTVGGNWDWRCHNEDFTLERIGELAELAQAYRR